MDGLHCLSPFFTGDPLPPGILCSRDSQPPVHVLQVQQQRAVLDGRGAGVVGGRWPRLSFRLHVLLHLCLFVKLPCPAEAVSKSIRPSVPIRAQPQIRRCQTGEAPDSILLLEVSVIQTNGATPSLKTHHTFTFLVIIEAFSWRCRISLTTQSNIAMQECHTSKCGHKLGITQGTYSHQSVK